MIHPIDTEKLKGDAIADTNQEMYNTRDSVEVKTKKDAPQSEESVKVKSSKNRCFIYVGGIAIVLLLAGGFVIRWWLASPEEENAELRAVRNKLSEYADLTSAERQWNFS